MLLSPYETKVLATIEKELREEDPALAAALSPTSSPPSSTFHRPLAIRHVLLLSGALIGLIAVHTVFADRLGVVGLAVLTSAVVGPWLVATVRSAERRSRAAEGADRRPRSVGGNGRSSRGDAGLRRGGAAALLAVTAVLTASALMPPAWQPVVGSVLTLAVAASLPRLLVRVVERFERRGNSSGSGGAQGLRSREIGRTEGTVKGEDMLKKMMGGRWIADDDERVSGGEGPRGEQWRGTGCHPCRRDGQRGAGRHFRRQHRGSAGKARANGP